MIDFSIFNNYDFGLFIENFITILFVITLFLVFYRYKNEASLKVGISVYSISYVLSNFAFNLLETLPSGKLVGPEFYYLQWAMYEALTIIFCFMFHLTKRLRSHNALVWIYRLSSINIVSCLYMHYLVMVLREPNNWFYSVYSVTVNATALMIVAMFAFNFKWSFSEWFLKSRLS
ncbi:hypothetical protein [Pseudoalteromonas denitrificans]|uniref:Uncharacterized protein n=1 Tax=Pseudoalteromonas denitrificans DSM 6059 TaxID=1123010 RepID=A0A1I1EST0_9GAMM|nr:hypothetical protein [Pseudoalteromonas denitrificans]SFB90174.1 hypothetical protein SAMN02745724_00426 [Pseudoalteromonas denitrificans DSM 6059]